MATPRRIERLQQMILQVVAEFIQRDLRDPRIGLVSITRVKLSKDLATAVIGWSSMGTENERRTTERGLENATSAIQRAVAHALQIRTTPALSFRYDDSLERSQELEVIFEAIKQDKIAHGELPDPTAEANEAEDATPQEDEGASEES